MLGIDIWFSFLCLFFLSQFSSESIDSKMILASQGNSMQEQTTNSNPSVSTIFKFPFVRYHRTSFLLPPLTFEQQMRISLGIDLLILLVLCFLQKEKQKQVLYVQKMFKSRERRQRSMWEFRCVFTMYCPQQPLAPSLLLLSR